jgi:hypothetical protein
MLSQGDSFMIGVRQKNIYEADMPRYLNENPNEWHEKILLGFKRNERLIDLSFIPKNLANQIVDEYENVSTASLKKILPYLMKHKLKLLIESIHEF